MKHGIAFGENIKTEKIRKHKYTEEYDQIFHPRVIILPVILCLIAIIFLIKLFNLQIIQGSYYRMLADRNRTRTTVIPAPRGVIFDRNGVSLVYNIPGFLKLSTNKKTGAVTVTHLSRIEALSLIAKGDKSVQIATLRQYPFKDALAHVLGYTGLISQAELSEPDYANYQPDSFVGQSGIEEEYEHTLAGQDGEQLIEVNANGQETRVLGQTDPIAGQDLTLTIDSKLQEIVYQAAQSIPKGGIIVSKPDGEILAMVSKPSFDPNLFTLGDTYKASTTSAYPNVTDIINDNQNQPLLNRVTDGVYPPGSTFKIIVAAAGLQDHVIDENFTMKDPGVIHVGGTTFANWYYTDYGLTEPGLLNVVRAITRSNDIFFYKLAGMIHVDRLSQMADKFGLGRPLGIDLPDEASGTVPTIEWKQEALGEPWYLGDTYNYGIGQGYLLTTPLQVNSWTQVIANNGTLYKPRLNKNEPTTILNKNFLSAKTISLIRQGMIGVCQTGGVAWPLFNFSVRNSKLHIDGKNYLPVASSSADTRAVTIACKTGTAQYGGENTLADAWITLFAPAYNPQIVITVLVENGGEGSNVAAPIAKEILSYYFSGQKSSNPSTH